MKYKVLTIAVASLLPLGFAASASAEEDPTADHEVTFVVAAERSISVTVNGEGEAVDFGAIGVTGEIDRPSAVTVTFSTPSTSSSKEFIQVQLWNSVGSFVSDIGTDGVTLEASAGEIEGDTAASNNADVALGAVAAELYGDFEETHLLESFDVDFKLITNQAELSAEPEEKFVVRYSLLEASAPEV
jgi:hypothetical protein